MDCHCREQGTAPDVRRTKKGKASERSDNHCHFASALGGTRGASIVLQGPEDELKETLTSKWTRQANTVIANRKS